MERSRSRVRYRRPGDHRRVLRPEFVVAAAAFLLSLTTAIAGSWFAIRGPEITASNPSRVFLYRDGDSITLGVEAALVNSASPNFGDVVTDAYLWIGDRDDSPRFRQEVFLTPVFSEQANDKRADCPITARCVLNGNFLSIEEPSRVLNVPGSSGSSVYVGFNLQDIYCAKSTDCEKYDGFRGAAAQLSIVQQLYLRFEYHLDADGSKFAECRVILPEPSSPNVPWLADQLLRAGWAALPCERDEREI